MKVWEDKGKIWVRDGGVDERGRCGRIRERFAEGMEA